MTRFPGAISAQRTSAARRSSAVRRRSAAGRRSPDLADAADRRSPRIPWHAQSPRTRRGTRGGIWPTLARRPWLRPTVAFHRDESGMMSMVHVAAVMLCVLLISFLLNLGFSGVQKTELQNAADSGAETTGAVAARILNVIASLNHTIGEVVAMIIAHQAVGGDKLDMNVVESTAEIDQELDLAHAEYLETSAAAGLPPEDDAYELVRQLDGVCASRETTEYDAKVNLKKLLTLVYRVKAAARSMVATKYPPLVAAGTALHTAVHPVELKIKQEYETLNQLHAAAAGLTSLKLYLRDTWLPQAKRHAADLVAQFPEAAKYALQQVAERNGVECAALSAQGDLMLPVQLDPNPDIRTSQLVRASFPWVNYHRQPVLDKLERLCQLCNARSLYKTYTERDSSQICDWLQSDPAHDMRLYVLRGYVPPVKSNAPWANDSDQADQVFAITVVAWRAPPTVLGVPAVFRQAHPAGTLAITQVLLYNANPLVPEGGVSDRQEDNGWDTLNWAPGSRPCELVSNAPANYPPIEVNWQAKLVPNSAVMLRALKQHRGQLPAGMAEIVDRLPDNVPPALLTH